MKSRERLLSVMKGHIPDRVPISTYELVGYNSQSFENNDPSYKNLMEIIRKKTDCICMWNPASNAQFLKSAYPVEIDEETRREDDVTITQYTVHTPRGDLTSTSKVLDNVHTVWHTERWCKDLEDVNRALSVPYEPLDYDVSDYLRITSEVGENGIIMASLSDALGLAFPLMEFGAATIWAMTETNHFIRTMDILHARNMENLRRMLDVNLVDLYRICGPEYATPPYLPPELFERFVVPYVSEMVNLIHERGAMVRFHCHGKIGEVIESILATGADGLDPCEGPPSGDITLGNLKQRVKDRMCLFGNLQLKLLEGGSEEEVEQEVIACMEQAKKGGKYIIMPTAAPINTPLSSKTQRNYRRYIETALKYGHY